MLVYKNFCGTVDYDEIAKVFFGTVIAADLLISYRGKTIEDLIQSFEDCIDSYIEDV